MRWCFVALLAAACWGVNPEQHTLEVLRQEELDTWGRVRAPARIVCLIPTMDAHKNRWQRISTTWGRHCDRLMWVFSSQSHLEPPLGEVMELHVQREQSDGARNIWEMSHKMWTKAGEYLANDAEWFVKVDDDTFFVVEHLRRFLQFYNPHVPHYLGHTIYYRWKKDNVVFNVGAAYVLSRKALQMVTPVLRGMKTDPKAGSYSVACVDRKGAAEDLAMSVCLASIGIRAGNTLDHKGRQRFLPFQPIGHVKYLREGRGDEWFWKYKPQVNTGGEDCCADEIITSHPYKGFERDDKEFTALEAKYHNVSRLSSTPAPVPPKPQWFLYDADLLDFEVDAYRNTLDPPPGQQVFRGYSFE